MGEPDLIHQAMQAIKAGERERAQGLLSHILASNPNDDTAWLLLAACIPDDEKKRYCLNRALAIRPDNAQARRALDQLSQRAATPSASQGPVEAAPSTPPAASQTPADEPGTISPSEDGENSPPEPDVKPPDSHASNVPAPKGNGKPASKKRSGFSRAQTCLVMLLAIFMLVSVVVLVLIVFQNQGLALPSMPSQPLQAPALAAPVTFLELPPTWTPTTTQNSVVQPNPTVARTETPGLFQTLLPSLTPISSERMIVIGRSAQNRPVEVYRFGNGHKERMIVAGIHGGDEGNTIALAEQLIAYLRRHPRTVPPEYTLYILRALNPDGEVKGNVPEARLNSNGVDLNRNFDIGWKAEWRSEGCSSLPGTGGSGPGSEPETQALKDFLRSRRVEVLISYHSAYLGVFPSGDPAHTESARLAQAIHDISNYPYPPVRNGCEYTGTLVDWAASNGVMAAVDVELNSGIDPELETNLRVLSLLLSFEPNVPLQPQPSPSAATQLTVTQSLTVTPTISVTQSVTPTFSVTPTP